MKITQKNLKMTVSSKMFLLPLVVVFYLDWLFLGAIISSGQLGGCQTGCWGSIAGLTSHPAQPNTLVCQICGPPLAALQAGQEPMVVASEGSIIG